MRTRPDLRLSKAPQFLPGHYRHASTPFLAFVPVEMPTPRTRLSEGPRRPAADTPPPSPRTAQRAVESPERSGPGTAGIDQALTSSAPCNALREDANTGTHRDPGAQPLASPLANPIAESSSGESSPVVRPAHDGRGVAA